MGANFFAGLLWRIFPFFYDMGVSKALPYLELIEEVVHDIGLVVRKDERFVVVDACCGTGNFSVAIKRRFPNSTVLGIDFIPAMIKRAMKKCPEIEFRVDDVVSAFSKMPPASAGMVVLINGFYPIAEKGRLLEKIRRVLKPGGMLILSDPCENANLLRLFEAHIRQKKTLGAWTIIFPALGALILSALFQYKIQYRFMQLHDILGMLSVQGFDIHKQKRAYASQNYYIVAISKTLEDNS